MRLNKKQTMRPRLKWVQLFCWALLSYQGVAALQLLSPQSEILLTAERFLQTTDQAQSKQLNAPQKCADANCKRVCYFRMDPQTEIRLNQVDGNLCTHVILAFVRIHSDGSLILGRDSDTSYLAEVSDFKRRYPSVKVMVSVYNEEEHNGFPKVAASSALRQKLARSTIGFLQRYNLDGIDLDWEFPNFPTTLFVSREHERIGLTKILQALRSSIVENFYDRQVAEQHRLEAQAYKTLNESFAVEPYLLTMAVSGQDTVLRSSYELKQVANLCDWLNIMSYDYFLFKAYSPFTGPNSPLFPIVDSFVPFLSKLSLSWTISKLLEEGVARDKIVMGIPTYARAYKLMFKHDQPGPFLIAFGAKGGRIEDYLDYREIIDILKRPDTIVKFDERARVPYLITDDGSTWISYENPRSVREKVRHIMSQKLGGYMTWNLNSDDFVGDSKAPTSSIANGIEKEEHNNDTDAANGYTPTRFPLHKAMLAESIAYLEGVSPSIDGVQSEA